MKFAAWCLLMISVAGCTLRAPQIQTIINLFSHEKSEIQGPLWLASLNYEGAVLRPYEHEGYTVFANKHGDAIVFDGWIVRAITGFGNADPIVVWDDKSGKRSFKFGQATANWTCLPWMIHKLERMSVWEQDCELGVGKIEVDIDGNIKSVEMYFPMPFGLMKLTEAGAINEIPSNSGGVRFDYD